MTSPGWNGLTNQLGGAMQSFGSNLVQARLLDMQLKNAMAQTQAQIAGNMSLEGFRQKFRQEQEFPHEKDMATANLRAQQEFEEKKKWPYERETALLTHGREIEKMTHGFQGQAWIEGIRNQYDLDKMGFADRNELFRMATAHGYRAEELKSQAAAEGKILDKKYVLEKKMKEHFMAPEHQNALKLIEARGKEELAQIQASGKQADETQMKMLGVKAAMEVAPEPMLDYILAKQHGLKIDPKTGQPSGDVKQMATFLRAKEVAKANNIGRRIQAVAKNMSATDPEGAKRLAEFTKSLAESDVDSLGSILQKFEGGGGGEDMSLDEFVQSLRGREGAGAPGPGAPAAETRPAGETGEFVPKEMPEPLQGPDIGSELGERGKNVVMGALNELGFDPESMIEKPEGSKFYRLTGRPEGNATYVKGQGGMGLLEHLNKGKTSERFIFNPQTGSLKEAPAKEAIGTQALLDSVWPKAKPGYDNQAKKDLERHSWEAIKEASEVDGIAKTVREVRKEHPELEVQEDSLMTEDLKVALLRLRAVDLARGGGGTLGGKFGDKGNPSQLIAEINRMIQEAKLGKGAKRVTTPAKTMGRGK